MGRKKNRKRNAAKRAQNSGGNVALDVKNDQKSAEITENNLEKLVKNDHRSVSGASEKVGIEEDLIGGDLGLVGTKESEREDVASVVNDAKESAEEEGVPEAKGSLKLEGVDQGLTDEKAAPKAVQKKAEIEIDGVRNSRRKQVCPWVWWLIGLTGVVLVTTAGMAMWKALGDGLFGGENTDVAVEEKPEKPEEEEKPEESPKEEPPKEEKPIEGETPKTPEPPIEERPQGEVEVPEVAPGSRVIALTFDDGPSSATTPRLLDILQQRGVRATFFVLGTLAERNPDIIRREAAEGHEVASHTPYHNQLTNLTHAQVRAEAVEMDRIFTEILGTVPPFTRPPYGAHNEVVRDALHQPLITWSIDPRDWADRNAAVVCNRVVSAAFDGAIILVHDIHATTVDAVPCIVDNLRAQGYEFLTVSELAAVKNVPLVNGGVYGRF